MKLLNGIILFSILLWCDAQAMDAHNEIKLELVNETTKIVAAIDQKGEYHDIWPSQGAEKQELALIADHHRSFKICAPSNIYTILLYERGWPKPIVDFCTRETDRGYYGHAPKITLSINWNLIMRVRLRQQLPAAAQ